MPPFALVGPSYALDSKNADCQRSMNWYVELIESGTGKSRARLARTPGLKAFCTPTSADKYAISKVAVSRLGNDVAAIKTLQIVSGTPLPASNTTPLPPLGAGQSGAGQGWTIWYPDTAHCDVSLAGGQVSNALSLTDFGAALPPGAVLNGIQLSVDKTNNALFSDYLVCLVKDGAALGDNKANGAWTSAATVEYGGASDLWGTTLTAADLSNSTLGIALIVQRVDADATPKTATISNVALTFYYTLGQADKVIVETQAAHGFSDAEPVVFSGVGTLIALNGQEKPVSLIDDTHVSVISNTTLSHRDIDAIRDVHTGQVVSYTVETDITYAKYNSTAHTIKLTLASCVGIWVGSVLRILGISNPAATALNGQSLSVLSVHETAVVCSYTDPSGVDFACAGAPLGQASPADRGFDAAPVADAGSVTNLVPSYALLTTAVHALSVGTAVTMSGLTTETWLNGTSGTISEVPDNTHLKVPVTHADVAEHAETGDVSLGNVSDYPKVRASVAVNGRAFFVIATFLYEVFVDGTYQSRGTLLDDDKPASIAYSSQNLVIAAAGTLYRYDLKTNVLTVVSDTNGPITDVSQVAYCDGYFLALVKDSSPAQFRWTDVSDETTWPPDNVADISVFPDSSVSMNFDHREIVFKCRTKSVVYSNVGDVYQPFQPIPGSYIDQGEIAPQASVRLDNSTFWIGQDDRGMGVGFRLQGYSPMRITNFAIEAEWQSYGDISDAVGYGFQLNGHSFWHVYFPTANKSWRYDVATGLWHEVGGWLGRDYEAHRSQSHIFCFGKHLVGDWKTGNIYEMSTACWDDNGIPIRRMRRAPHVSAEGRYLFFARLDLEGEIGGVTITDPDGTQRAPQIMLRWSDDDAHTWSNEHWKAAGELGEYGMRVYWLRMGRCWGPRGRVYELVVTDAAPWSITEAYLS